MEAQRWSLLDIREKAPQHQQVRFFYEGESAAFGDRGFVARIGEEKGFFPVSKAAPLPERLAPKGQLAVQPIRHTTVPQQDINPSNLPLEAVWKAMRAAQLPDQKLLEVARKWGEAHSGCLLEANAEGELRGEVSGWSVVVME